MECLNYIDLVRAFVIAYDNFNETGKIQKNEDGVTDCTEFYKNRISPYDIYNYCIQYLNTKDKKLAEEKILSLLKRNGSRKTSSWNKL